MIGSMVNLTERRTAERERDRFFALSADMFGRALLIAVFGLARLANAQSNFARPALDWMTVHTHYFEVHYPAPMNPSRPFILRPVATTLLMIVLNVTLFSIVPKGFFPQQDTGRLYGAIQAGDDVSFQAMKGKLAAVVDVVRKDPAVANVLAFTGGGSAKNSARMRSRIAC